MLSIEDVMQVTYIEVFLHIHEFQPRGDGAFHAWLRRIAENNLRDARNTIDADERLGMSGTIEQAMHTANWALALFDQDAFTEAEPFFRESLELRVTLLGERHIITATVRNNLGRWRSSPRIGC